MSSHFIIFLEKYSHIHIIFSISGKTQLLQKNILRKFFCNHHFHQVKRKLFFNWFFLVHSFAYLHKKKSSRSVSTKINSTNSLNVINKKPLIASRFFNKKEYSVPSRSCKIFSPIQLWRKAKKNKKRPNLFHLFPLYTSSS